MNSRRVFLLAGFVISLGVIASLQPARGAAAGQGSDPVRAALQKGTLEVWAPDMYFRGRMSDPNANDPYTYRWTTLLDEFKRDFPDFDLRFSTMKRAEFLSAARSFDRNMPDVAFLDNVRELEPLMDTGSAWVQSGLPRFDYNGWWVISRRAKNLEGAKAFLLWLSRSPTWKPMHVNTGGLGPDDMQAVQSVSKRALQHDMPSTASVEHLMTFGTSRLACALLSATVQTEKSFGISHSLMVVSKGEEHWNVLLSAPGPLPDLERHLASFDRIGLENGPPEDVPTVALLRPEDHAKLVRDPPCEFEWATVQARVAAYVVEWQYGQRGERDWEPRGVWIVRPEPGKPSMSLRGPRGAGEQPHRWRVWAIGTTGTVSMSPWRTIDFTN